MNTFIFWLGVSLVSLIAVGIGIALVIIYN